MKKFILFLFIVNFTFKIDAQEKNSVFDFSGMDIFWEIFEYLENDKEAPTELWEKLYNNPGYKTAIDREFGTRYFKSYFEMAYMPSKKEDLQKRLEQKNFFTSYLEHLVKVKENKDLIKEAQKRLENSPDFYYRALEKTSKLLPAGTLEKFEKPVVSFIIFGPDGRGYEPIIIDLLYFETGNLDMERFLAHELHHAYMDNFTLFKDGQEIINWVTYLVYSEAMADQIDKIDKYYNTENPDTSEQAVKYRELVEESPEIIVHLDSLLSELYHNQKNYFEKAKDISRSIPMSGHTLGYFMASKILEYEGREELMKDFGNHYAFFFRYNGIAKENGLPSFSESSMQLLKDLEQKYK